MKKIISLKRVSSIAKKLFATALAAVLLFGLMPVLTAEANDQPPAGYTAIRTAAELQAIGNSAASRRGNYWLANDIDISHINWNSIGTVVNVFAGNFDGNNKTISGLWSSGQGSNQGLFARIEGGIVKDLTIKLDARGITGTGERKGGLTGNIYGANTIVDNVHVIGVSNAARTDNAAPGGSPITGSANYISGFAGAIQRATVRNSSVTNVSLSGASYVAGFMGVGYVGAKVDNCHVTNVRIEGTLAGAYAAPGSYAAGFAGGLYSTEGTRITNSSVDRAVINARSSYPGGFVGALYDSARVEGAVVNEVHVNTTGHYAGGFAGAIYNSARATDVLVSNSTVRTGVYNAGGFASAIYNSARVTRAYVVNTTVTAGTTGAGGFVAVLYNSAQVSRCGVSQSLVTANHSYAGGFAALIYNYARVTENFAENTNVRVNNSSGNLFIGGFVGHLYDGARLDNNYANAWTRPVPTTENPTPGPRPGLSIWKDSNGRMIPATIEGSGNNMTGGFAGAHSSYLSVSSNGSAPGVLNAYTSIPVNNVNASGRGAFTGSHVATGTAGRYRGTNYFDDWSSNQVNSPDPFPGATNPIPTYVGFSAVSESNWRGDTRGTSAGYNGQTSFPRPRITDRMVLKETFLGWGFATSTTAPHDENRPWHIEEGVSYPYFLFGFGYATTPDFDTDWERLRTAINIGQENQIANHTIVIYPFGTPSSVAVEDLTKGILVIRDEIDRSASGGNYIINSNGVPIVIRRTVTLASSNTTNVTLNTRNESDGRHFIVSGNNDITFTFRNVVVHGRDVAGGISAEFTTSRTLTLSNATIRNCRSLGNGGGIWASEGTKLNIAGGTSIRDNRGTHGAGIYILGEAEMTGGTINNNRATSNGGGVWNTGAFILRAGTINDNRATSGGGIWSLGTITISGGTISGNRAVDGSGGGILSGGRLAIAGGVISDNTATVNGGGVMTSGAFEMFGGSIVGNTAYNGGGVWNGGSAGISLNFNMAGGTIGGAGDSNNRVTAGGLGPNIWNAGRARLYGSIGVAGNRGIYNIGVLES